MMALQALMTNVLGAGSSIEGKAALPDLAQVSSVRVRERDGAESFLMDDQKLIAHMVSALRETEAWIKPPVSVPRTQTTLLFQSADQHVLTVGLCNGVVWINSRFGFYAKADAFALTERLNEALDSARSSTLARSTIDKLAPASTDTIASLVQLCSRVQEAERAVAPVNAAGLNWLNGRWRCTGRYLELVPKSRVWGSACGERPQLEGACARRDDHGRRRSDFWPKCGLGVQSACAVRSGGERRWRWIRPPRTGLLPPWQSAVAPAPRGCA
jgi:hypothetical protein